MRAQKLLAEIVRRVDTDEVARLMVERFRAEIDSYRELPEQVADGAIVEVSRHNLELFLTTLAEGRPVSDEELVPFRVGARLRASEGLPLEDMLHAYRIGGRLGWDALVAAATPEEQASLLPSVAGLMEYVDRVSDAVTETYHDERRHLMSAEERRVHDLFVALVAGAPVAEPLSELAGRVGLPLDGEFRPFALRRPDGPAHAHAQLAQWLRQQGVLAVSEGDVVVGLLAPDREALPALADPAAVAVGEPAAGGRLADALADTRALLGLMGESAPDPANVADFLPELLLTRSPQLGAAIERRALGPLEDYSERRSADLLATLGVFVDCELDRRRAAERLHVHPNTLDYRLRRVEELTGLSLARPRDLTLVCLALQQRRLADA